MEKNHVAAPSGDSIVLVAFRVDLPTDVGNAEGSAYEFAEDVLADGGIYDVEIRAWDTEFLRSRNGARIDITADLNVWGIVNK